jgi:diguanylate cyclase (GGDEF)-like protein/PAS domain S-box-containing protein
MIRTLFLRLLLLLSLFGAAVQSQAAPSLEPVKIGVLAFRPKPQTLAQWQPLAQALKQAIPERDFVVQALTLTEMNDAVANRQLDFVLTNSGHYVLLTRRSGLQAPLATLLVDENGQETSVFGGVIFVRAGSNPTLAQLKGKKIATVSVESIGGYQMQAFELLQAGLELPKDAPVLATGMPQDKVVQAVLGGSADVGFVRTGLLEAMVREGKLDMQAISVVNPQKLRAFPVQVSTALYPEWPFSYLSHVDERLARQVTAALFMLKESADLTRAMGIRGFSVPADYTPVDDLLRTLRLPPFDVQPAFTLRDVAMRYRLPLIALAAASLLILLLGLRLWLTSRQLRAEQRLVLSQQQALLVSEFRSKFAIEASGGGMWDWDITQRTLYLSDFWKAALGYGDDDIGNSPDDWEQRLHPEDVAQALLALNRCLSGESEFYANENRVRCKDGSYKWIKERGRVVSRDAQGKPLRMIGLDSDITQRKLSEEKLELASNVFTYAREGISITDADGKILDVNDAFSQITGYSRAEVLGQNPRLLSSGRHDKAFYAEMYKDLESKDHWYGEIWNRRKDGEVYVEMLTISTVRNNLGGIKNYVAMFFDITSLKQHQQQLEHIAHYDALTSLPNRVLLADRLHQAMLHAQRRGQLLAVAYLDLDGFKAINDTHGHQAGDQLLIAVSASMKQALREGDTLARLGGDEFVAVLADQSDSGDSATTLGRLLVAAAKPVPYGEYQLQVSASLGVTFYPQADSVDADQLLRQADQAMYQAKVSGKNRYHVFDAEQDRSVRGQHESIEDMRRALVQNEFVLYYQPKVNLRTGRVVGAEALIRWQHPEKGLLQPGHFLPVIEDHAFSIQLGEWVIGTALSQIALWQAQGQSIAVSVNVAARQLQQEHFVQHLCDLLAHHPTVSPAMLELEILETSALEDLERTSHVIIACSKLGVQFALDDFGTGYSSLTYLKHLPVTLIKIDQSFVRDMLVDPDDLAILEGVISLAHAFKRQVIAEGMESSEHGTRLLQLGCELAQGYGIARPMPAADFMGWLKVWQPDPAWV